MLLIFFYFFKNCVIWNFLSGGVLYTGVCNDLLRFLFFIAIWDNIHEVKGLIMHKLCPLWRTLYVLKTICYAIRFLCLVVALVLACLYSCCMRQEKRQHQYCLCPVYVKLVCSFRRIGKVFDKTKNFLSLWYKVKFNPSLEHHVFKARKGNAGYSPCLLEPSHEGLALCFDNFALGYEPLIFIFIIY